ncbi:hypothetical protein VI817_001273 [Penicillium citrinum]|nr:hypothetical protein VI817_001273 [Penicillium citrinum]
MYLTYRIPSKVQNGTAHARFEVDTFGGNLSLSSRQSFDAPQVNRINSDSFDWWYFDVVDEYNPLISLVVTFFKSSASAFPFLDPNEDSVLTAYVWVSFGNGPSWAGYLPASLALVDIGGKQASLGIWEGSGFQWNALKEDLSAYEVVIDAPELEIKGRLDLVAIAPHIGWVSLVPDAVGSVDMTIQDTQMKFQGVAYHDKNWSDRNFTDSVRSWYWGHGRLGLYSIVWFSYLAINDPTNTTYVSSYVAHNGEVLISECDDSLLTVRPTGRSNTTGDRYPAFVGDLPDGFKLDFVLPENTRLRVNVSTRVKVAGDGEYYMRWTGNMTGEVVEMNPSPVIQESSLTGVAVFEQFHMQEQDP